MKKAYLTSVSNIVTWFYHSLTGSETMSLLFKEQRQVDVKNGFLGQLYDTLWNP